MKSFSTYSKLKLSLIRGYSLLRHGGYSLASQSINSATNFFTGILIGRLCSKEEYGLYALGFSLVMLFAEFQTSFISMPYMVFSPRLHGSNRLEYAGSSLIHQLCLSALASLLLFSGLGIVSFGVGPGGLMKVLKVLAVVITLIMLKEFIRQLCFAMLNTKSAFLLDTTASLIQVTSLSLLALLGALSAERAFVVAGIACGTSVTLWFAANKNSFILKLYKAMPDFLRNWALVKWIIASHILWVSAMSLYPWFIATFHGVEATGVWAACLTVIMIGNLISVAIQNMLGPKFVHVLANSGVPAMRGFVFKSAMIFAFIMLIISVSLIIAGNSLVVLFYGFKYDGNGLLVSLLAINLVLSSVTFSFSRGLIAMERADMDFILNIAVVMSLLLGIWLVRTFGLLGAAYGLLIANSLASSLRVITFIIISSGNFSHSKQYEKYCHKNNSREFLR
jgi:O-antigen/teichoic acid export membrane protein